MSFDLIKEAPFIYDDVAAHDYEFIHVRLTDAALRDLEQLTRNTNENRLSLSLGETSGSLAIRLPDRSSKYTFTISKLDTKIDNSLDCLKVKRTCVTCLGQIRSRYTVDANEESFSMAKEKIALLEDDQRKNTKNITLGKRGTKYQSQEERIPKAYLSASQSFRLSNSGPSSLSEVQSTLRKQSPVTNNRGSIMATGSGPSPPLANAAVSRRPLRERVIHLLALRPYHRAELLLRLARDSLSQSDKVSLDEILSEVGSITRRDAYQLSSSIINELDPHWPGYSAGERNQIISLKEKYRNHSPSETLSPSVGMQPQGNTVSPSTRVTLLSTEDDQFARRPTLASAPSAPHALSKKIAALDLLVNGVGEVDVSTRLGVGVELLRTWRNAESELRERYAQQTNSSNTTHRTSSPSQASISRTTSKLRPSTLTNSSLLGSNTVNAGIPLATQAAVGPYGPAVISPGAEQRNQGLLPPKRARLSAVNVTEASLPTNGSHQYNKKSNIRLPPLSHSQDCDYSIPPIRSTHTMSPATTFSDAITPHNSSLYSASRNLGVNSGPNGCGGSSGAGGVVVGGCTGTGSEGESAPHTPCSAEGFAPGPPVSTVLPATSVQSSSIMSTDVDLDVSPTEYVTSLQSSYNSVTHDSRSVRLQINTIDQNESVSKTADLRSSGMDAKLEEIDRLFPRISDADQVEFYRAEFQSTYPTYLRMYHSFSDIWQRVNQLRSRLLNAAHTEGLDSNLTSSHADALDRFLCRVRTHKYRDDQNQLTLLVYKLRLLKKRLVESRQESGQQQLQQSMPNIMEPCDVYTNDQVAREAVRPPSTIA